jgi:protease-4
VIKSGPYKDILAFDRELTDEEKNILQALIDVSYGQFVKTVAEARRLSEETVRSFADGRIFTGEQALALGVVDRLGSEEEARRWTAELVGLDPEKAECITLGEKKGGLRRLLPGNSESQAANIPPALAATGVSPSTLKTILDWIAFDQSTNGLPLWLYRP